MSVIYANEIVLSGDIYYGTNETFEGSTGLTPLLDDGDLGTTFTGEAYYNYYFDEPVDISKIKITGVDLISSDFKIVAYSDINQGWIDLSSYDGTFVYADILQVNAISLRDPSLLNEAIFSEFVVYGDLSSNDSTAPLEATNLSAVSDGVSAIKLTWTNSVSKDLKKVYIYKDNVFIHSILDIPIGGVSEYEIEVGTDDNSYDFKIISADMLDNKSVGVSTIGVFGTGIDVIPPSEVTSFVVNFDEYKNVLTWINPSDYDFSHVEVYKNDVLMSTTSAETVNDYNIVSSTEYTYKILAVDTSDNKSEFSTVIQTTGVVNTNAIGIVFDSITDYFVNIFSDIASSVQFILISILGLTALVVGAFFLLGLGKKAVKKAK